MKRTEKKKINSTTFAINLGLLLTGLIMVFSGLIIQFSYHMGNHGEIKFNHPALGFTYYEWSDLHKIMIVMVSSFMIFHIKQHWKWYKIVIRKNLIAKNRQVIILSVLFILVALTGYIPWFVHLSNESEIFRKTVIEIHDKLALILTVYLVLHLIKRIGWFFGRKAKCRTDKIVE
ncbi:MAG: hypothetical protein A2W91_00165 [Bacteroidetes bacterium GWF2_38_335]|nr:MAG: hypothetical protein A2W91_00165 [Bacteroidetes bacterium GWF2_38_335]OFY79735.1 MAG: hypothetical protein A2281_09760 [Bacteroidetes bacterium RIFOXYA12_FULL_38_20]HBS87559.1 hypothetical protein [Bacteroidales bacterium]